MAPVAQRFFENVSGFGCITSFCEKKGWKSVLNPNRSFVNVIYPHLDPKNSDYLFNDSIRPNFRRPVVRVTDKFHGQRIIITDIFEW